MRDGNAAEHLLHDDFEVLACGRNTLQFVDACDLVDDVLLRALLAGKGEDLLEVRRTVCKEVSLHDRLALFDERLSQRVHAVLSFFLGGPSGLAKLRTVFRNDRDDGFLILLSDLGDNAGDACDHGGQLRHATFKYFLDARQTHRDVAAGGRHTSRVEGTHRQLGARLTDGLCGNDSYRFTYIDKLTCCEVGPVTFLTYAPRDPAGHR